MGLSDTWLDEHDQPVLQDGEQNVYYLQLYTYQTKLQTRPDYKDLD